MTTVVSGEWHFADMLWRVMGEARRSANRPPWGWPGAGVGCDNIPRRFVTKSDPEVTLGYVTQRQGLHNQRVTDVFNRHLIRIDQARLWRLFSLV